MTSAMPPATNRPHRAPEPPVHPDHDRGLEFDVRTLVARRSALGLLGGAGLAALAGCTDGSSGAGAGSSAATSGSTGASASPSVTASGTASAARHPPSTPRCPPRRPARSRVTAATARTCSTTPGSSARTCARRSAPRRRRRPASRCTVNLTVLDSAAGYGAMPGVAVYVWHCDAQGRYSMYSRAWRTRTTCAASQPTDASGTATFTTVFPGCYPGRWPHIHFEVYRSTAEATSAGQIVRTRQLALPAAACEAVYADTATYPGSADASRGHVADPGHGLRRRRRHPPARDGDRRREQRLRREPHHRSLTRGTRPSKGTRTGHRCGRDRIGRSPSPRGGDARPRPGARQTDMTKAKNHPWHRRTTSRTASSSTSRASCGPWWSSSTSSPARARRSCAPS